MMNKLILVIYFFCFLLGCNFPSQDTIRDISYKEVVSYHNEKNKSNQLKEKIDYIILKNLALATCFVKTETGYGTGIVIGDNDNKYVLTALHVVSDFKDKNDFISFNYKELLSKIEFNKEITVEKHFYLDHSELYIHESKVEIFKLNPKLDIVILKLKDKKFPSNTLKLGWDKNFKGKFAQKIFSISNYSTGINAYTEGYIANPYYLMVNSFGAHCPVVAAKLSVDYGGSGGPVFNEKYQIIGICIARSTKVDDLISFVPMNKIYSWMEKEKISYILE